MNKTYLDIDVLTGARQRIEWAFGRFERLYLTFSGGKDSTAMLHLVAEEARKTKKRFGILFIDLEGQYKMTIDHVRTCFEMHADVSDPFWVSLPIHLRNAVSVFEPHWICWDKDKQAAWIREPEKTSIMDESFFPFFHYGMEFEEFTPKFGKWYAKGKTCACFVGIRAAESFNRMSTIFNATKETKDGKPWTTRIIDYVYNVYPIYDWETEDIWTFHARHPNFPYNRLYNLMHMAGLTIHQMRICQPYGDDQRRGLWLFHVLEPETWSRVVARVNGANSGALYSQNSGNINGYLSIRKPDGHTWRSFAGMLLSSMPQKTREHYENKIAVFRQWWIKRGYPEPEGIPDECDTDLEANRKVPSWRRICKALLRNDYWCKGLSFAPHRSEAYEQYLKMMNKRKKEWNLS